MATYVVLNEARNPSVTSQEAERKFRDMYKDSAKRFAHWSIESLPLHSDQMSQKHFQFQSIKSTDQLLCLKKVWLVIR